MGTFAQDAAGAKSIIQHQTMFTDPAHSELSREHLSWGQFESFEMRRLWDAFLRWRLLVIAFVTLVTSVAWIISVLLTPRYEARAILRLDGPQADIVRPISSDAYNRIDPVALETQVEAVTGAQILEDAARGVGLRYYSEFNKSLFLMDGNPNYFSPDGREALFMNIFRLAISVKQVGASGVVGVSVRSRDPFLAARTANAIAETFIKNRLNEARARRLEALDALVMQQSELERQLDEREGDITRLQQKEGLLFPEEVNSGSTLFANVRQLFIQSEADLAQAEKRYGTLDRSGDRAGVLKDVSFSPLIQELRTTRTNLLIQLSSLVNEYGPQHPRVTEAKKRLADMDATINQEVERLASALRTEADGLRRRVDMLRNHLEALDAEARSKAQARIRLTALAEQSEDLRRSIQTLKTQIDSIGADLGIQQSSASFISRAAIPIKPVFPNKKIIVGGAMVGSIGMTCLFLLAITLFERRITSFSQIGKVQAFTECAVLGALPLHRRSRLSLTDERSSYMRNIEDIVWSLGLQQGSSTSIGVCPLVQRDGASTFSKALGLCCARLHFRTLLIDPSPDGTLAWELGLEALEVHEDVGPVRQITGNVRESSEPGLYVLHRPLHGQCDIPRHVASSSGDVSGTYDVVIIDCPSLTANADALRLAAGLDRVFIVTTADMRRIGYLRFKLESLVAAFGIRPEIVLNRVDRAAFIF